jgi:hypothetical protein
MKTHTHLFFWVFIYELDASLFLTSFVTRARGTSVMNSRKVTGVPSVPSFLIKVGEGEATQQDFLLPYHWQSQSPASPWMSLHSPL